MGSTCQVPGMDLPDRAAQLQHEHVPFGRNLRAVGRFRPDTRISFWNTPDEPAGLVVRTKSLGHDQVAAGVDRPDPVVIGRVRGQAGEACAWLGRQRRIERSERAVGRGGPYSTWELAAGRWSSAIDGAGCGDRGRVHVGDHEGRCGRRRGRGKAPRRCRPHREPTRCSCRSWPGRGPYSGRTGRRRAAELRRPGTRRSRSPRRCRWTRSRTG